MNPIVIGGGALALLALLGKKKPAPATSSQPYGPTVDGTPPTTHIVASGDTVSGIAAQFYDGDPLAQSEAGKTFNSWIGAQIIADANPAAFGPNGSVSDWNTIPVGLILNIPALTSDLVNTAHSEQSSHPQTPN